ncbi:hypothetical protein UFOVP140_21 [uncultured Caudovirales phage]|uniref:Uncharacterized protein n=1 Tax=uncultured Caudovirales phage TaxID=2100421 RepID=A0A6J5LHJ2_9CAUD|nr:hypothetical protein UFOVP140_21 [uncultured Caudovirales phage]
MQNQQVHPILRDVLSKCLAASAQVAAQAKQFTPPVQEAAK